MQSPSLPPELWNLSAVILLCGLMGWMIRLVRLMLIYLKARFAIQQNAVIHLEKLGPSLHVLRHASMWHFHQLLRTQLQTTSTSMKRVRVPFEIVASSVKLVESSAGQQPLMNLSIEVRSERKFVVQVFWDVKAGALEGACHSPTNASTDWPLKQRFHAVQPTRAARTAIHAMRSLPGKLYDRDHMNTPHRLLDDESGKDIGETNGTPKARRLGPCLTRLFGRNDSFRARCAMERKEGGAADEFVAPIPSEVLVDSPTGTSVESSVIATDCEEEKPPHPVTRSVEDRRYACVVIVGSPAFFENTAAPKSPSFSLNRRFSSSSSDSVRLEEDAAEDEVLCQCVAIDFLLTPARPSRVPVVVKKLNLTANNVFTSHEIFGRDSSSSGGECVICLEKPPGAVLLPCRHFCVCRECLEEIDQCPICRAKFSTYTSFN
ncbi:hypothetical protein PF004_g20278 [Phytophthora fragariae]|uniref:RING-type domain-containing protein n=1 Tax=Phytophthora fragariae TaxID=53985 RepID=A0A6A3JDX7_9STRA|nr:hypothetical protein PF011_g17344 [Phytophthora fragariae]KAE9196001.1 hypothetical protein PF004_g20278 [Phytophthora fragariae]